MCGYKRVDKPLKIYMYLVRIAGTAWVPGWGRGKLIGNGSAERDYQLKEIDIEINTLEKCHQRLK